jgi:hypothetical protein
MNGRRRRWITRRLKMSKKWDKKTTGRKFESLLRHLGASTPSVCLKGIHYRKVQTNIGNLNSRSEYCNEFLCVYWDRERRRLTRQVMYWSVAGCVTACCFIMLIGPSRDQLWACKMKCIAIDNGQRAWLSLQSVWPAFLSSYNWI